jgi:hypothetical protein
VEPTGLAGLARYLVQDDREGCVTDTADALIFEDWYVYDTELHVL